jgi:hypothetical protein
LGVSSNCVLCASLKRVISSIGIFGAIINRKLGL